MRRCGSMSEPAACPERSGDAMAMLPLDRDLQFGLVAVEMNFIDRAELIETLHEWREDTTRTLSQVLVARNSLTSEEGTLVDALVMQKLRQEADSADGSVMAESAVDGLGSAMAQGRALRYQVLWGHAKGGLGEVFLAEDTELHRRVALKEIQARHASNPVSRERFVAEAEITGNLEHPGIVPVYGLGTRDDGRPFYAMRFIKGEDLMSAIRRFHSKGTPNFTGLEFRWLLRKLIDVCNTVAYAHSRGVLHRDLKPANIMIGPFGETLVMDWGVAKLMARGSNGEIVDGEAAAGSCEPVITARSTNGSATMTGQALGTPTYMSPEQAGGRLDALGPASDVYSLGATLYVLLTDRRPFQGGAKDVLQMVRAGRYDPPRQVEPRVPQALDAICRRAMAVEPSHRYQSALNLAVDIERWLADEPVSAWCDPWGDKARRWVRQHQPMVAGWAAAVGVALMALVLAVPLLSLAWRNELAARQDERFQRILALARANEAQANEAKAKEEKDRAQKALQFLVDTFRRPDPLRDGRAVKVLDVLDQAMKDLDRSLNDEPLMKATLLSAIGETFSGLGMHTESFTAFQRALSLRRESLGNNHRETLSSMNSLAMAYYDAGRFDTAISMLETTLERRRNTLGDDHVDTIETSNDLSVAYWKAGQAAKAVPLYESTLIKVRRTLGEDHEDTLTIMDNLAVAYVEAGQHEKAIALHQAAIARFNAKLGQEHLTTLITMNNLARAYQVAGRTDDSIELYETTLAKLRGKLSDDHPTTLATMNGLALSYRLAGKLELSLRLFEATLIGRRTKLGSNHPETLQTTFELANGWTEAGKPEKAIPLARGFLAQTAAMGDRLPAKVRDLIPRVKKLLNCAADQPPHP
jgi:eukaryotic-like serine/threonine-protein kinase